MAILDANEAAEKLWDISRKQFLNMRIPSLSAEPEKTEKALAGVNRLGGYEVSQRRLRKKDGTEFLGEVSVNPFTLEGRSVVCSIVRDITERKKVEEALSKSEKRLQAIFEGAAEGILVADVQTKRFKYANQAVCDLLGYSRVELCSLSVFDIHPRASLDHVIEAFQSQAAGEKVFASDLPCLRKDGTIIQTDIRTTPLEIDGISCNVGFFSDVTDRKKAEEIIRREAERFRILIDQAADAFYVHDLDGRYLEVNRQACAALGYTRDELLSMCVSDVDPDAVRRGHSTGFWPNLPVTFEARNRRKDGTIFPVEVRLGPVVQGESKVVLGVVRDISDRQRAEQELQEAKNLAEMANRAKSEFLANMSHELRTPLNSIIGFSELLEDQFSGPLNETQRSYAGHIAESGRHLLQLVNQLLGLSRIESGGMDLELSEVSVCDLLRTSIAMVKEQAWRQHLDLELNIAPEIGDIPISGDELKLRQVVLNLLSNAVKFTQRNGKIQVGARKSERELIVSVSDTGLGIDEADTSRIFRAFEQADSSSSRRQEGTGLGLALARKLVEMHGGRIWVESEGLGKGSTFSFAIPRKAPE